MPTSTKGRSGGAAGRGSGSRGSQNHPAGKAIAFPQGTNKNVQEILRLIDDLRVGDLRDLSEGLALRGLIPQRAPEVPTWETPKTSDPAGPPEETPVEDSKAPSKTVLGDPSVTKDPKSVKVVAKVSEPGDASGATRRTMFRKARKAVKDTSGNPEGHLAALRRLRNVAERFGASLEESLPDGYVVPDEILKALAEGSDEEDGEDSEEGEELPPDPLPKSSPPPKGTPDKGPKGAQ